MECKTTEKLENEIFCLNYEMQALSTIIREGQMERWVPGFSFPHTEVEHLARYEWAAQFVKGKQVLDIACGAGLGSYILATTGKAKEAIGCDIDPDAIRYASFRRQNPNLIFKVANAEQFEVESDLDVIISFETIEHLPNPELFLQRAKSCLKEDGYLLVSTPINSKPVDESPSNHHHVREWGFCHFQDLISKYFTIESIFVQLYLPRKTLIEKIASRFLKHPQPPYIPRPVPWSPDDVRVDQLGTYREGYQILRCRLV